MHRYDRLGARRDRRLDQVHVHVVVVANVDQDGGGADVVDHGHRRHERVRHGDDLVARPDADRFEQQPQAVSAVADADRVGGADEGSEVVLEVQHLLAHDEVAF